MSDVVIDILAYYVPGAGGSSGPQGPAGPQGPVGPDGVAGAQGLQGDQGVDGAQGLQGDPGSDGAAGAQGDPGTDGATGADGPQGAQGLQGVPGLAAVETVTGATSPSNTSAKTATATCPSDKIAIGGGHNIGGAGAPTAITQSSPTSSTVWAVRTTITDRFVSPGPFTLTAIAICATVAP